MRINNYYLLFDKIDQDKLDGDNTMLPGSEWKILLPKETSNIASDTNKISKGTCQNNPCKNGAACIKSDIGFSCEVN